MLHEQTLQTLNELKLFGMAKSFAERINCRLVKTGSEQGHTLFWERARPQNGK